MITTIKRSTRKEAVKMACLLVSIVMLLISVGGSFTSCMSEPDWDYKYSPIKQAPSQWMSDDGRVFISTVGIGSEDNAYGYILINGERFPVIYHFDMWGWAGFNFCKDNGENTISRHLGEAVPVRFYEDRVEFTPEVEFFFPEAGETTIVRKLDEKDWIDFSPVAPVSDDGKVEYDNSIQRNAYRIWCIPNEWIPLTSDDTKLVHSSKMAVRITQAGIKDITDIRIAEKAGNCMIMHFKDSDGTEYTLIYDINDLDVVDVGIRTEATQQ